MRTYILISSLVLAVWARPEAGYNYPQPGGVSFTPGSGVIVNTASTSTGSYTGPTSYQTGYNYVAPQRQTFPFFPGTATGTVSTGHVATGQVSTGHVATGGIGHVHRHIYVYGPPEADEIETRGPVIQQGGAAQKHYKIIFIKAPSYQTYTQAQIQLARQNEEKTLVYVLVKKPEDQEDIRIDAPAPTAPSKPEVYFIKYKANKQATGGISTGGIATGGIVTGGIATGGVAPGIIEAPKPVYGAP